MDLDLIANVAFAIMVFALVAGVMIMDYLPDPDENPAVWQNRVMVVCFIVAAVAGAVTVAVP